jgi:hypothetical protein
VSCVLTTVLSTFLAQVCEPWHPFEVGDNVSQMWDVQCHKTDETVKYSAWLVNVLSAVIQVLLCLSRTQCLKYRFCLGSVEGK